MSAGGKGLFCAKACKQQDLSCQALAITISGTVQGVGFRPFVYRLAKEMGLCGQVANTCLGVRIEAQGTADFLKAFVKRIKAEAPALARIERIKIKKFPLSDFSSFSIAPSSAPGPASTTLPPDVAVCDPCLAQVCDSKDRRFGYPFTNCTQCGPRFTIACGLPYDRAAKTVFRHAGGNVGMVMAHTENRKPAPPCIFQARMPGKQIAGNYFRLNLGDFFQMSYDIKEKPPGLKAFKPPYVLAQKGLASACQAHGVLEPRAAGKNRQNLLP